MIKLAVGVVHEFSLKCLGLWDARKWQPLKVLTAHKGEVKRVAFSHGSRYLATASGDTSVGIWDVTTFEPIAHLLGHMDHVFVSC